MMKFFSKIFSRILLLLLLPSCIEVVEKITINADGSGSIQASIDMGKLGASLNNENIRMDVRFLEMLKNIPRQAPQKLNNIKGISNVKILNDDSNGLYSIAFDFKDARSLNDAIYRLFRDKRPFLSPAFYKISKHRLVKKDISPYLRKAFKTEKKNSANDLFFSWIHYKTIYVLPEEVKSVSNIKSKQPDNRTVITDFTLDELLKGDFDFGNKIRY